MIEPQSTRCPCCGDDLHVIGEDRFERLDKIPAKYRVIVTRRPKYACRICERTGADETVGVIQRSTAYGASPVVDRPQRQNKDDDQG